MKERQVMLQRPPHILVTTPESLYILLTAEKSRAILRDVETVIVDEIHAVADDKRGVHLSLSLERLEALVSERGGRVSAAPQFAEKLRMSDHPLKGPLDPAALAVSLKRLSDTELS